MLPKFHLFFGIIFVVRLHFLFPQISFFNLSIIFLSSFLIDVDHVFYYFLKTGDINPVRVYRWYMKKWKRFHKIPREQRKNIYSGFYLFHGIEVLMILFLLGFYISPLFSFIFIGFSFHLLVDTVHERYDKGTSDKFSLIYSCYQFRKLKF